MIAPACSAAFPTIGSNIMLIKLTDTPHDSEAFCHHNEQQIITNLLIAFLLINMLSNVHNSYNSNGECNVMSLTLNE